MFLRPARNSRIEKPFVHQTVSSAAIGMNQGAERQTLTRLPANGSMMNCAMPNCRFSIQSQIR